MRTETTLRFKLNRRAIEVKAFDTVGVEDCYDVLLRGVLHRYATGEDWVRPIPREIKDWIIRQNLFV